MRRAGLLLVFMVIFLILPLSVFAISYTLSVVSSSSVNLYTGETTPSPTGETKNIEPTQPQSSPPTQSTQTKTKETPSGEIKPIQPYEVAQVLNKLGLQELKDGSIIELHISESRSEVFTIFIRNGFPDVTEDETPNEDILIWISRQGFFELQKSDDVSRTIKTLVGGGQISLTQKASTWTLWRKGYKSFVEKLGIT